MNSIKNKIQSKKHTYSKSKQLINSPEKLKHLEKLLKNNRKESNKKMSKYSYVKNLNDMYDKNSV